MIAGKSYGSRKCRITNRRWIPKDNCRDIGGERFDDFDIQDIEEILKNRTLNEELAEMLDESTIIKESESSCSELAVCFTLKIINDGLGLADKLEHFIDTPEDLEKESNL